MAMRKTHPPLISPSLRKGRGRGGRVYRFGETLNLILNDKYLHNTKNNLDSSGTYNNLH
ncbi:hypothetical protein BMS3Abin03_03039 [bacterium BMS3Abin03]|nr:hypothetical protein BMS3Abin03_03039 [bacterium BMS3Abin03]